MSGNFNIPAPGSILQLFRLGPDVAIVLKKDATVSACSWRNGTVMFSPFRTPPVRTVDPHVAGTSFPFFLIQLCFGNAVFRPIFHLAQFLRLPNFVAQMLAGILLGPSVVGSSFMFRTYVFPYRYAMVMETFSNLALIYHMFLVGLEMDLSLIKRAGTKALSISISGILFSFVVAMFFYSQVAGTKSMFSREGLKGAFWAVALGTTSFSDLVRILSDLKLLRTETGKTAMAAAIISDLLTWFHFVLIISIFTSVGNLWAWITTTVFIVICWFFIRPALSWAISKATKEKNRVTDHQISFILSGVVLFGLVTDVFGAHAIVGAFLFGIIMPEGHIVGNKIVEKIHNFVSTILLPIFYLSSGLRFNFMHMFLNTTRSMVAGTVVASCASKIVSTYLVSLIYGLPSKEGLALGLLMNTKGILAQVIVNVGRDMKVLDNQAFAVMMLSLLVTSCLAKPILSLTYKPTRITVKHNNRTIEKVKLNTELRILACVHNLHNASSITALIRASYPTGQSPLCIFAMHLVEFTGRTAASILITNNEYRTRGDQYNSADSGIVNAFELLEEEKKFIRTHTVTAVSPYDTMQDDICSMAEDKHVSFIILPFHKRLTAAGVMEEVHPEFGNINQNVLATAPCSVGILVDRGLGALHAVFQPGLGDDEFGPPKRKHVGMIFLGGSDDREALIYAWRMAGHPKVELTVIRYIAGEETLNADASPKSEASKTEELAWQREKEKDDECLYEFTFKTMNVSAVKYVEKVVNDGSEMLAAIRELEDKYDLCIVGRAEFGVTSPLLKGLSDWESSQSLGIIGDVLASSNFSLRSSILVVQQYCSADHGGTPAHTAHVGARNTVDAEPFMSHKRTYDDDDDDDNGEDDN